MNMENNIHLKQEIDGYRNDIKATEELLYHNRKTFAEQIKNGMGNDIKNYLDNPPKPNYIKGVKIKFKRWWNNR